MHTILRQYLHVEANGTHADGLTLQHRLSRLCRDWLIPTIEQVLERCEPLTGYLIIERLEIDVGTVMLETLEQELPTLVALALENAIQEQRLAKNVRAVALADNLVQHKTALQSVNEAFIYFLETGSLPWSFRLPKDTYLEQALLNAWREAATAGEPLRAFRDAILPALASTTVRQRLIRQFSPVFLEALLPILSPEAKSVIDGIVLVLHSTAVSSAEITAFEQKLWQSVFADVVADTALLARHLVGESWRALPMTTAESIALASVLERHWPGVTGVASAESERIEHTEWILPTHPGLRSPSSSESEATPGTASIALDAGKTGDDLEAREAEGRRTSPKARAARVSKALSETHEAEERRNSLEARAARVAKALPETQKAEERRDALKAREAEERRSDPKARDVRELWEPSEARAARVAKALPETQEAEERRDALKAREARALREHPEAKEGIYVENAGLVLLHPFLPRFFAVLDITAEDAFLQPERALCLLHFLATGQSTAPEYELILPKILCNLPLLAPVETNLELTEAEKREAVVLLEAVIRHWSVLRNTSPDGLRGAFLLRPGKVSLRDDGDWLLQVESNSVDILLDQLPWGISMIKLPWMDKMLWVEWG